MKVLALVFGGLKFGKLFASAGTMALSLAIYASIWGWPFAAGFVALLLLHELGHFAAARQRGLDVGLPTFIPFIGAWIELKDEPLDAETEAYIAAAGPFVGTLASVATYLVARQLDSNILLAVSYSGLFLNLFNLLPISPLDGGRIVGIVSPRLWLLGAPLLVAVFLWRPSPMLVVVGVMCLPQMLKAWRYDPETPESQRYYGVSNETKFEYGAFYLGLAGFLAVMAYDVHEMLAGVRG